MSEPVIARLRQEPRQSVSPGKETDSHAKWPLYAAVLLGMTDRLRFETVSFCRVFINFERFV